MMCFPGLTVAEVVAAAGLIAGAPAATAPEAEACSGVVVDATMHIDNDDRSDDTTPWHDHDFLIFNVGIHNGSAEDIVLEETDDQLLAAPFSSLDAHGAAGRIDPYAFLAENEGDAADGIISPPRGDRLLHGLPAAQGLLRGRRRGLREARWRVGPRRVRHGGAPRRDHPLRGAATAGATRLRRQGWRTTVPVGVLSRERPLRPVRGGRSSARGGHTSYPGTPGGMIVQSRSR